MTQPAPEPSLSTPAQPPKVPFDLQDGELVVKVARRHWAFLTVNLGKVILIGLVPIVALAIVMGMTVGFDGTAGRIAIGAMVLWFGFWAFRAYFTWYKYQNDQWVLTNQRIVDSQRNNWFHHRLASADLVNVEDMSINKSGIFPTMFNYGDLLAQTAGSREKFVLSGIPEPTSVLALVDRYRDAAKRELIRGNIV
jgi:hypothetical protein